MKNTIDFLLYSYFGVTPDDADEAILTAVLRRAKTDALQQRAYYRLVPKEQKEASGNAQAAASEKLFMQLKAFQNPKKRDQFDTWHEDLCGDLVNKFTGSEPSLPFTFGNAQKWINMSLKYLLMFCEASGGKRFSAVGEVKAWLHIPVDSYIIEKVWVDTDIPLPTIKDKLLKDGKRGAYDSEKVTAWSKWDDYEGQYMAFQDAMRKKHPVPIDWEGPAWIAQAKAKKSPKKKQQGQ